MKGRTPKTFAMLLLASALAVTAGCGNSGGNAASEKPVDSGDTTTPITFTFFGADASPNWNNMKDAVGQEITKATAGRCGCNAGSNRPD